VGGAISMSEGLLPWQYVNCAICAIQVIEPPQFRGRVHMTRLNKRLASVSVLHELEIRLNAVGTCDRARGRSSAGSSSVT